jgi:hypothetical protein
VVQKVEFSPDVPEFHAHIAVVQKVELSPDVPAFHAHIGDRNFFKMSEFILIGEQASNQNRDNVS